MTEASPITHFTAPGKERPGKLGPLAPSTEGRMVDPATGADIGVLDEDGYLEVVDRLKELIKVKGYQVAPAELEAVAFVDSIPKSPSGKILRRVLAARERTASIG